jgi:hypothetical protein
MRSTIPRFGVTETGVLVKVASSLPSSLVLAWPLICTVRDLAAPAVPALAAAATPSGSAARQRMTAVRRMVFLPVADWWFAVWLRMFPPSPSLGVRCFAAAGVPAGYAG